ncbi:MAG: M50 family metallopeptidase, partial [Blastocatellia bacterium]
FVGVMTMVFGFFAPIFNFFATVTFGGVLFTVFSGAALAVGLAAIAKFANLKWANFSLAFLAVQCLLNSVFSLVDLFFISAMTGAHSDAVNMAAATGIPGIIWVFIWMGISLVMITIGLRIYAVGRNAKVSDSVFED